MKKVFPWWAKENTKKNILPTVIEGKRVILRVKKIQDLANDYMWRSDEELARLDATRPLQMSFQEYKAYMHKEIISEDPYSYKYAILSKEGVHIGNCMLYDLSFRQRQCELGILIGDRKYWDKGYGTEVVSLLLLKGFATNEINRIYLHTLDWNMRAQRSFLKAGFKKITQVRRNGFLFIKMEACKQDEA